jgi:hypothetical protein
MNDLYIRLENFNKCSFVDHDIWNLNIKIDEE